MTPKRDKWYNSLSPEEKMTRIHLGYLKHSLSVQKERLADLNIEPSNQQDEIKQCQGGIRATKVSIRILRKQIAMDVMQVGHGKYAYSCPTCHTRMSWREAYQKEFYCGECRQKLRW